MWKITYFQKQLVSGLPEWLVNYLVLKKPWIIGVVRHGFRIPLHKFSYVKKKKKKLLDGAQKSVTECRGLKIF